MAKKFTLIALFVIISAFLTILFDISFSSYWFKVNFSLALALLAITNLGLRSGVIISFVSGLLIDIFSQLPFGTSSLALIIPSFLIGSYRGLIYKKNLPLYLLLSIVMTFTHDLIIYFVIILANQSSFSLFRFLLMASLHTLLNFISLIILKKPFLKAIRSNVR